ncbi:MAG: hypothetical protein ACI8WP_001192, partial [Flavobacteriaceae bacterium]
MSVTPLIKNMTASLILILIACFATNAVAQDFFEDFNSGVSMPTTAGTTDITLPSGAWLRNNAVQENNDGLIVGGTGYGVRLPSGAGNFITSPKLLNAASISFTYTAAASG